jgi:hypothetical protein
VAGRRGQPCRAGPSSHDRRLGQQADAEREQEGVGTAASRCCETS